MNLEDFKRNYSTPTTDTIATAQLIVDELTPDTQQEKDLIRAAKDYLAAARVLHHSSRKLSVRVF